jgi:para-nitrobenzyl esterase
MDGVVQLPGGRIRGFNSADGRIFRARGIKYAEAKRFEKSTLVSDWSDIWDCTKPASIPPQKPSRMEHLMGPVAAGRRQDEDCLHVSIAGPAEAVSSGQSGKLPVMVFFHGGAYVTGGGDFDCYQGTPLARRGAVVVNVTHRLGIFGYPISPDGKVKNLGLMDQILALRWVRTNISCFGGNPENVTIFGQSAGGDSIFCMMLLDETKGLFHKAILQSAPLGGFRNIPREGLTRQLGKVAAECFGEGSGEDLSTQEVLDRVQIKLLMTSSQLIPGSLPFGPSYGNEPLPQQSQADERVREFAKRGVPTLICYTKDDGSPFAQLDPWWAPKIRLPIIGPACFWIASWLYTRRVFQWGSQRLNQQLLAEGAKSGMVLFSWSPPNTPWGAAHCIDLPFILGTWTSWENAEMLKGDDSKDVLERVGGEVQKLFVDFAKGADLSGKFFDINGSFRYSAGDKT